MRPELSRWLEAPVRIFIWGWGVLWRVPLSAAAIYLISERPHARTLLLIAWVLMVVLSGVDAGLRRWLRPRKTTGSQAV